MSLLLPYLARRRFYLFHISTWPRLLAALHQLLSAQTKKNPHPLTTKLDPSLTKPFLAAVKELEREVCKQMLLGAPLWLNVALSSYSLIDMSIIQHWAQSVVGGINRGTRVVSCDDFLRALGQLEKDGWVRAKPPVLRGINRLRQALSVWEPTLTQGVKSEF